VVDRESAYEILNRKLATEKPTETAVVKESKNSVAPKKKEESYFTKQVIKVLTSATFIRGAFGVLTKIFKK